MARTSVIRIKAVIEIPYQSRAFGAAAAAEAHSVGIRKAVALVLADATLVSWDAQHTTTTAHESEPAPDAQAMPADDVGEMPGFLQRGKP